MIKRCFVARNFAIRRIEIATKYNLKFREM